MRARVCVADPCPNEDEDKMDRSQIKKLVIASIFFTTACLMPIPCPKSHEGTRACVANPCPKSLE